MRPLRAGAIYFLIVFAAGWVMAPIRALLLIPRLGSTGGYAIEAVIMLIVMALAALWAIRRFAVPADSTSRIAMGLAGLVLLLIAELLGSWWIRGLHPVDYVGSFDPLTGLISLILYAVFAAMPALLRARR
jgi:hypothetical protein